MMTVSSHIDEAWLRYPGYTAALMLCLTLQLVSAAVVLRSGNATPT